MKRILIAIDILLFLLLIFALAKLFSRIKTEYEEVTRPTEEICFVTQIAEDPTPTEIPTQIPTEVPTETPTEVPTIVPTIVPTATPTIVPTVVPTATPSPTPESNIPQLGEWFIVFATSYTDAENMKLGKPPRGCKDNIPLVDEWSIASFLDEYLPYGTIVEIENMGVRIVCDTCNEGGAVWNQRKWDITQGLFTRAKTWVDIYFESQEEADAFGRSLLKIRVLKYGDGETYISKEEWENGNS